MKLAYNSYSASYAEIEGLCNEAAICGFDGVGLAMAHVEPWSRLGSARRALVNSGYYVHFAENDGNARPSLSTALRSLNMIDCAPLVVIPARSWSGALDSFADLLRSCLDGAPGSEISLEPLSPRLRSVSALTDFHAAERLVRAVSREKLGVVLDVAHIPPDHIFGLSPADLGVVRTVHLCDVQSMTRESRCLPGQGILPLREICGFLIERGFKGWWELEVYGPSSEHDCRPKACLEAFISIIGSVS